jgi:hypothetical protein
MSQCVTLKCTNAEMTEQERETYSTSAQIVTLDKEIN